MPSDSATIWARILPSVHSHNGKGKTMSDRIQLLEDALQNVQAYTKHSDGWRPGLVDIFVYNYIMDMYEGDTTEEDPDWFWNDTPDHGMESIMNSGYIFDIEYGAQDLWEALRDYLHENGFIRSTDEDEEEEE